ncbi:MAG: hypothetical protein ACXV3D_03920 [Halobacteriota archaeon]
MLPTKGPAGDVGFGVGVGVGGLGVAVGVEVGFGAEVGFGVGVGFGDGVGDAGSLACLVTVGLASFVTLVVLVTAVGLGLGSPPTQPAIDTTSSATMHMLTSVVVIRLSSFKVLAFFN